jgi:tryptophan synthase alpha subunit
MSGAERTIGRDRPILGCYLQAGDPGLPRDIVQIYRDCGVDLLEFGLPCADPFLDGAVIEQAMARAIAAGFSEAVALQELKKARSIFAHRPIVVVTYGSIDLTQLRNDTGQWLFDAHLDLSCLAMNRARGRHRATAPVTPPAAGFVSYECREDELAAARDASLYVMLQAMRGRTGGVATLGPDVAARVRRIKATGIRVPVLLGIGISTPQLAAQAVALGADGVIIGSRCLAEAVRGSDALRRFVVAVREAINVAG